jgi:hypothetical protein
MHEREARVFAQRGMQGVLESRDLFILSRREKTRVFRMSSIWSTWGPYFPAGKICIFSRSYLRGAVERFELRHKFGSNRSSRSWGCSRSKIFVFWVEGGYLWPHIYPRFFPPRQKVIFAHSSDMGFNPRAHLDPRWLFLPSPAARAKNPPRVQISPSG